jgi:hypothetical protein
MTRILPLIIFTILLLTSCLSEEERMAEHMCQCVEKPREEFKECMGEDYNKLEEYDHSDKEDSFMETLNETCPDAAKGVHL